MEETTREEEKEETTTSRKENDRQDIEKISNGAYGCIYYPSIPCGKDSRNEKDSQYITKVQDNDLVSDMEFQLSERIMTTIPEYNFYYAPIIKKCIIDMHEIEECQQIQKGQSSIISYKIKYLGEENMMKIIPKWYKNLSKTEFPLKLLDSLHYILFSLKKLHDKAAIIHNDLKLNNIMYNTKHKTPILIDFGLSFSIETLENTSPHIKRLWKGIFFLYSFNVFILGKLLEKSKPQNQDQPNEPQEETNMQPPIQQKETEEP